MLPTTYDTSRRLLLCWTRHLVEGALPQKCNYTKYMHSMWESVRRNCMLILGLKSPYFTHLTNCNKDTLIVRWNINVFNIIWVAEQVLHILMVIRKSPIPTVNGQFIIIVFIITNIWYWNQVMASKRKFIQNLRNTRSQSLLENKRMPNP